MGGARGGPGRVPVRRPGAGVPDRSRRVRRDDLCPPRARSQHRGRLRGPPRPRLRGVLRDRSLQHGAPELAGPRLAALRARLELLGVHLDRGRGLGAPRRSDRRADPARAGRLPRDHHARIRRDHPRGDPQSRRRHHRDRELAADRAAEPHRRRERRQPRRPPVPARRPIRDRPGALVLPDPRHRRRLALGDESAARLATGSRLDGDSRGRDRRRLHGRQPDLDQAPGLRARCLLLWVRRIRLCRQAPGHHAGRLRVPGVDHAPLHGRPQAPEASRA